MEKELKKQSREPFKRALQRVLGFAPTGKALEEFANKHPDRWAQAVTILAGLSGYEKGVNVTLNTRKPVEQMTDAELLEEYMRGQVALTVARARGADEKEVAGEILPPLPVGLVSEGKSND